MLKSIVFWPGLALESRIACRSEPAPLSFVLVTSNVLSSSRFSNCSSHGRQ
jgi:hypothetical protein